MSLPETSMRHLSSSTPYSECKLLDENHHRLKVKQAFCELFPEFGKCRFYDPVKTQKELSTLQCRMLENNCDVQKIASRCSSQ